MHRFATLNPLAKNVNPGNPGGVVEKEVGVRIILVCTLTLSPREIEWLYGLRAADGGKAIGVGRTSASKNFQLRRLRSSKSFTGAFQSIAYS